ELLVDDDGLPQHLPWEDWRPGEEQHSSAWMRATAPNGDASYLGEVAWAAELGAGVRRPERGQKGDAEDRAAALAAAEAAAADHDDHGHDDHGHGGHH